MIVKIGHKDLEDRLESVKMLLEHIEPEDVTVELLRLSTSVSFKTPSKTCRCTCTAPAPRIFGNILTLNLETYAFPKVRRNCRINSYFYYKFDRHVLNSRIEEELASYR
jgi:hypothetical protein